MELLELARQPEGRAWPTDEWASADPPSGVDGVELERLTSGVTAEQPADMGTTLALLVVHEGRIVAESYASGVDRHTELISWSMAKSMLQIVLGFAVLDGRLALSDVVERPEWSDGAAPITVEHLLTMRSGLQWSEDYLDDQVSDVIEMLFGSGSADMAAYAANTGVAAAPDSEFVYSSGTTNILSALLNQRLDGEDVASHLQRRLFDPLGMTSARPTLDEAGTWVASSYVHATARDFARCGLLMARDGVWDGQRLLPEGWVDLARTTRSIDPSGMEGYGHHWWTLRDELGSFCASGYEGQRIVVVPANDLVIVRLGKTPADLGDAWKLHLDELARLF